MDIDRNQALDFLSRLGSHPVVSFYEKTVLSEIELILSEIGIDYYYDGFGNVVATFIGTTLKDVLRSHSWLTRIIPGLKLYPY